jgi:23S rRNA pseudouridine1911/1915/1917 synthase
MIEKKSILVNDKPAKASHLLKLNDVITIQIAEKISHILAPYPLPLDIIYEDSDLLVVNKPAGLVGHPAVGHEQDTLVNALIYHTKNLSMKNEERPGIVHRIDKETSGLLVVAKNDVTHENLSLQFKNKTTHRVYYAIIEGRPQKASGHIESYLVRHPKDRKKYCSHRIINKDPQVSPTGKWASTHYTVLQSSQSKSLLEIKLETGRTHQIRVHMQELGHPLVGDTLYGFSSKKMKELNIHRFFLHAAQLGFIHPHTKESMIFKVDWPEIDLRTIKKWGFHL